MTQFRPGPGPYDDRDHCTRIAPNVVPFPFEWTRLALFDPPAPQDAPKGNGTVYLSGPITGESYETARFGWRKYVADRLNPGIKPLSPMRHEGHLSEVQGGLEDHYPKHFFSDGRALVEKDELDILRSDIVLVNLQRAHRVSIGSVYEIGFARAHRKMIILVVDKDDKWHKHPFVRVPAAMVLTSLDDAIDAVNSLLSEGI